MDSGHLDGLEAMAPSPRHAHLHLMLEFHPNAPNQDVPDPYYGGGDGFELVYALLDESLDGFLDHIKAST
jgi:protein-tyrosine phosphatase